MAKIVWVGLIVIAAAAMPAAAITIDCGDVITLQSESVVADNGLSCDDAGGTVTEALLIQGSGVLDLNGQVIECTSSIGGIIVDGPGITVQNGVVESCLVGMVVTPDAPKATVANILARDNEVGGFLIFGEKSRALRSAAIGNGDDGFDIDAAGVKLDGNYAGFNEEDGFSVEFNALKAKLVNNVSVNNGDDGFDTDTDATALVGNTAILNFDAGFGLSGTSPNTKIKAAKNLAVNNAGSGFEIDGSKMKLQRNLAQGNGVDGFSVFGGSAVQLAKNVAYLNQLSGFYLDGSLSKLKQNVALFNNSGGDPEEGDLTDALCDDNTWSGNVGSQIMGACIPVAAPTTPIACGDTIVLDGNEFRVGNDITCDDTFATALVVQGSGTVDMNGHRITCEDPNSTNGVVISGPKITLANAAVIDCGIGVDVTTAAPKAKITNVLTVGSVTAGFRIQGEKATIQRSSSFLTGVGTSAPGFVLEGVAPKVVDSTAILSDADGFVIGANATKAKLQGNLSGGSWGTGFASQSGSVDLIRNVASGNLASGFSLASAAAAPKAKLSGNHALSNQANGYEINLPGAKIEKSRAHSNGDNGIEISADAVTLATNDIYDNGDSGIHVESAANKGTKNVALGNNVGDDSGVADIVDQDCTSTWSENVFGEAIGACIE